MKRGSSAAKQSGWNGNRPGVIALGQRIKYFPIGRCSSTGKSAVTGYGGSKVFKTLKATCFLVRQHGGERCWNRLGSPNPVPISPFGNGGKIRPIDAPHITDRQIHKTLCNEVLIPLYSPSMIYDNGASQKGKGLHWQFKRIKQQLWIALPALWPGRCCVAVGFERVLSKCFPRPVISAAPGIDFES